MATRYASTNSVPPPVADVQPTYTSPEHPSDTDFLPSSLQDIVDSPSPVIREYIGFLKELGLDYGWGPTAFIQTMLEYVHIYTGTPWWVSILLTALLLRALMLKVYINAADTSARLQLIKPQDTAIKAKLSSARAAKDFQATVKGTAELQTLYRASGIQMWRLWIPMLQVPLGYGTFRLLRGMALLPVPGFDQGGLLWIKDLTLSDPYAALPIVAALAFYYTFKVSRVSPYIDTRIFANMCHTFREEVRWAQPASPVLACKK